ncbi:acid ceramidase-like [Diadema antillarum]|uniref:acid ceramidase-like n=1 Tax=Diadema antillarum TaxID=105358 RepID=UPI003A84BDE8
MAVSVLIIFVLIFSTSTFSQHVPPFTDELCNSNAYPPPNCDKVDTFVLNLDLEPEDRWTELVKPKAREIDTAIQDIIDILGLVVNVSEASGIIDEVFGLVEHTLKEPYGREMQGIADATGISIGRIVFLNLFYEVESFCTAIVAEDKGGNIYHARNMDPGILLGWDIKNKTWSVKEAVMGLIANVEYQRGGVTVARGVHYAGYVGMLTGMKPGVISMNMNARHLYGQSGFMNFIRWIFGKRSGHWTGFVLREAVVMATDFNRTVQFLTSVELLVSSYIIVGGTRPGEGVIISRAEGKKCDAIEPMELSKDGWFVMKTNYDTWKAPPFYDNRRIFANKCLRNMTQANVGFAGIYNVMSTKPVLNLATAYTTLIRTADDKFETYRRYCTQPCFPW